MNWVRTARRFLINGGLWGLLAAVASAEVGVQVPLPTGPYRVGTRTMYLMDAARRDPYAVNSATRELAVRFWYPSSAASTCRTAPYTSLAVWSYLAQLTSFSLPPVTTNSCENTGILSGPHPV